MSLSIRHRMEASIRLHMEADQEASLAVSLEVNQVAGQVVHLEVDQGVDLRAHLQVIHLMFHLRHSRGHLLLLFAILCHSDTDHMDLRGAGREAIRLKTLTVRLMAFSGGLGGQEFQRTSSTPRA
jgi:hypothetical protein